MGANTSAGGLSDFGLRGIQSPHAMPHTQNFGHPPEFGHDDADKIRGPPEDRARPLLFKGLPRLVGLCKQVRIV
jgi:hypothetical protein